MEASALCIVSSLYDCFSRRTGSNVQEHILRSPGATSKTPIAWSRIFVAFRGSHYGWVVAVTQYGRSYYSGYVLLWRTVHCRQPSEYAISIVRERCCRFPDVFAARRQSLSAVWAVINSRKSVMSRFDSLVLLAIVYTYGRNGTNYHCGVL